MLRELHIKNIAVIEEITVQFNNGFQALTGETGAGKSILIDSINMALGGRGSRELIRTGAEFASVDLTFEIENQTIINELAELGIDCDDGIVLIARKLTADGKSKCNINGRLMPIGMVKEVGEKLLTIHGQNDNQSILSPKSHIGFVDEYAENSEIMAEYKEQYKKVKEIQAELAELSTDESEKESLTELLSFQLSEIDAAKLKIGEEGELTERKSFLQNAERIAEGADGAYYDLHGSDDSESGACDFISDAVRRLEGIKDYDSKLSEFYDVLVSVMADVDDVMHELHSYIDAVNYSPTELDDIEGRLSLIYNLKRKYGNSVEEIIEYANNARERLEAIESSDERLTELTQQLETEREKLDEIAQKLTKSRVDAAYSLQENIMNELADLDMQKIRFSVSICQSYDNDGEVKYSANGCDNVEFLISANPGEELKPLSKIASGGEMSRIMLAIKSVLSDSDLVETMIFDEIDTGVSGRAAQKIAEKIGALAHKRQILCITHLPQIAAMADYQYKIEKNSAEDSTRTTVTCVSGDDRINELARIIGGVKVTEITFSAAKEMVDMAEKFKAENNK